jgi:hypothetical protein
MRLNADLEELNGAVVDEDLAAAAEVAGQSEKRRFLRDLANGEDRTLDDRNEMGRRAPRA